MKNPKRKPPEIEGVEYKFNDRGMPILAVVTLDFPLEDMEPPVKELRLRRMKAKDGIAGEDVENKALAGFALYAELAKVSPEVISELDVDDLERVGEATIPLMGKSARVMADKMKAELLAGET